VRRAGMGRSGSGGRLVTRAGDWFGGLTINLFATHNRFPAHTDEAVKRFKPTRAVDRQKKLFRKIHSENTDRMVAVDVSDAVPRVSELRQRMPAAVRRNQLLEVALERFAVKGYHETSMEEIADAAGVTKPVLYQHFHSKRKLYLELLDTVGQGLVEDVASRAAAEENPYRRVLAGFRAYFHFVCERSSAFQLLFGSGARRPDDEFADAVREVEERIAAIIAAFIDADIDDEHRDLLGHAIVGLGEVAGRRWMSLHEDQASGGALDPAEAERLAVRLADLVWAGLRSLPGGSAAGAAGTTGQRAASS
jgi:AcrR family transcriptional regulator